MRLFTNKWECSGCRACEQICPQNCIKMEMDREGFMYPVIDEQICISCGLCVKVCKNQEFGIRNAMHMTYAAYNKNREVRKNSSSGGIFYELGRSVIEDEGMVFGAVFGDDFQVYHKGADNIEEMLPMMGSKYVQSDTGATYSQVQKELIEGKRVLYSGTPCQIAGLKKYLRCEYEKLICVSVICHGVPSSEIWGRYLTYCKGRMNNQKLIKVEFRNKLEGWRHFHYTMHFAERCVSKRYEEDIFVQGFLQNLYLRPACYSCPKNIDYADIILGDYWGIENVHPKIDDGYGVSAIIINTLKGKKIWERIEGNFITVLSDYESCAKYNPALYTSVEKNCKRVSFYKELEETGDVAASIRSHLRMDITQKRMIYQYPIVMKYLKNKVKGWNFCEFLREYNYKKIVLYAITEFTALILDDILGDNLPPEEVSLCDTNADKYERGYAGYPVIGVRDLLKKYQGNEVDCIIVCNLFYENEIIKMLMEKGIAQIRLISVASIVFSTEDF